MSERTREQWLAHVYARGDQIRWRRRMVAGGVALGLVAAVLVPTVVLSGGGSRAKKLNVASGGVTSTTATAEGAEGVVNAEPGATTSSTTPATTAPSQPGPTKKSSSPPARTTATPHDSVPTSTTPNRIAFASGGTIGVVDDNGAHGRVIAHGGTLSDPQWSPDATRVAYLDAEGAGPPLDVYVVDADGTDQVKVAASLTRSFWPAWSPDGRSLAISGNQTSSSAEEIYVVGADGRLVRALTTGGSASEARVFPAWSPDGRRLAFICGSYDICTIGADGTNLRHLGVAAAATRIAWSPDGNRIAFYGYYSNGSTESIVTVGADGSDVRVLKSDVSSYDVLARPVWSPDGKTLAFDSDQGAAVIASDGTGFRVLAADKKQAAWSPDGAHIVVTGASMAMTVVALNGSAADIPGVSGSQPQYQPR